jgi:hypothetical protein
MRYEYRDDGPALASAVFAVSDDRGEYRLFNLPPGAYFLRLTQPSGLIQKTPTAASYYPGVLEPRDAVSVTVDSGAEIAGIDIPLIRVPTFSVRVNVSGAFDRIFSASFIAFRAGAVWDSQILQAESLGSGVYRLSRLPPGAYEILATVRAALNQQSITHTGRLSVSIRDEDVDAGALPVRPGVTFSGVLRPSHAAVALDTKQVTIALRPFGPAPPGIMTGARGLAGRLAQDGALVIPNVPQGRFRLEVLLPEGRYLESARYGTRDVVDSAIEIYGEPDGPLELLVGGPESVGAIDGIVRNRSGEPAPDAVVLLVPSLDRRENPNTFKTAVTDQRGIFAINGVRPGAYTILAWEDIERGAHLNPDFLKTFEKRGAAARVERGSRTTVEALIAPQN